MKKILKILGVLVGLLVLVAAGGFAYVELSWSLDHPNTPYPDLSASSDPEVIARGEYLAHAVAHCSTCHGPKEVVHEHKLDVSQPLQGGFAIKAGPFGTFVAANITQDDSGIGAWSDRELARLLRHGVDRRGKLQPFMRIAVGPMADEDIVAIMSWLRTLKPVATAHPRDELGFIGKLISKKLEPRAGDWPAYTPPGGISVERGRYLAEGPAMCSGCHTPYDAMDGFRPSGAPYSGSADAEPDPYDPSMNIATPNITPDPKTGRMAGWSEEVFLARFRQGRVLKGSKMPWDAFAHMTDEDLQSIYRYLQTVPAVENDVGPIYYKAD